jgi:Tfp pilus assembly protein PilE
MFRAVNRSRTRKNARGVGLIELMNVLTLVAILAALTMYGVARYTRHTKVVEATDGVLVIAKAAAVYYDASDALQPGGAGQAAKAMRHFPSSSRTTVPELAMVAGKRYRSSTDDWAKSPWMELSVKFSQPQHYAYGFKNEGSAGAGAKAKATAVGDTDGDGVVAKFSLAIAPGADLKAVIDPNVNQVDPEE